MCDLEWFFLFAAMTPVAALTIYLLVGDEK